MASYFDALITYARKFLPGLFAATGTPGILGTGDTDWTPPMAALYALNDHVKLQDGSILMGYSGTGALTDPTTGPSLAASTGGSLATGSYDVVYSYVNTFGETLSSGATSASVTGPSGRIVVTTVTPPAGATVNWYVSDAPNTGTLRLHTSNAGSGFNINSVPAGGNALVPSSNTTASADHAEKGLPTGSSGIVVTPGPGTLDFSYSPVTHNDQNGYYLKRLRIENFTTDGLPAGLTTADKGRLAWDTVVSELKGWDGTDWVGGGGEADASTTVKGITKLSVAPVSDASPIAVGDNDSRMTNARTPVGTGLTSGKVWVGNGSNVAAAVTPSGDATVSNAGAITLASTAVAAGSYTNADITVDAKGRLTAASNGSGGTPADADATTKGILKLTNDLAGTAALPALATTGVSAGSYTNANITVDAKGRLTAATNGAGGSAAAIATGTSFPGSPSTNDQFIRTDLDEFYFYNGTTWVLLTGGGGGSNTVHGAKLKNSTNQTTSSNTKVVTFDTELFDTDGYHDGTNPSRITIPTGLAGYYQVTGYIQWGSGSGTGQMETSVYLNGSFTTPIIDTYVNHSSSGLSQTASDIVFLDEGDYIELFGYSESSDRTLSSQYGPLFTAVLLGT